jgi:hypothetical protein
MNRNAVLDQLDECARHIEFPMLDNGYIYPIDLRMHIMRSEDMWMIIIEDVGYNNHIGSIAGVSNCLHLFGSNLHRNPGIADEDYLNPFDWQQEDLIEDLLYVRSDVDHLMIRGKRIPVDLRPQLFSAKGIKLISPPKIDAPALLRSLVPEYRDLLLATPIELAQRNPHQTPTVLVLEEWYHPDLCSMQLPSKTETFQMLAALIETGNLGEYRPTLAPNTHWSNWPEGGKL